MPRYILLALLLSLVRFTPSLVAQEVILLADSSHLSTPPWSGDLGKFAPCSEGWQLKDTHPSSQHNQATLLYTPRQTQVRTWQGTLSFRTALTRSNRFILLITPLSGTEKPDTNSDRYAYLASEEDGSIGLFMGDFSHRSKNHIEHINKHQDAPLITTSAQGGILFASARKNVLSWHITYSPEEGWRLYLKSNLHPDESFHFVGSNPVAPAPKASDKHPGTALQIHYSSRRAEGFTLHRLAYYPQSFDPEHPPHPIGEESIFADIQIESRRIILLPHEAMDIRKAQFNLQPSRGKIITETLGKGIYLSLEQPFKVGYYSLFVQGLITREGEPVPSEQIDFEITHVDEITDLDRDSDTVSIPKNHLLLSEVLPFAPADGAEFIELFNPTSSPLDLTEYAFAIRTEGRQGKLYPITLHDHQQLAPGQYRALTPWKEGLLNSYHAPQDSISEMEKFPALHNKAGQIVLYSLREKQIVEEMYYGANDPSRGQLTQGVSLERILFSQSALARDNWHTALPSPESATPGQKNSRTSNLNNTEEHLTPQQMAFQTLQALSDPQSTATLSIYTLRGYKLAQLGRNETWRWCQQTLDGTPYIWATRLPNTLIIVAITIQSASEPPIHLTTFMLSSRL